MKIVYAGIFSAFTLGFFTLVAPKTQAATFTVNETGDQSDFSAGDGSCDRDNVTAGSQCTLRAAIAEANALAGTDNIFFNIPTTDTGYRDYDTPDTLSSGDSTGGDDYWTIRPATALPTITTTVIIDGSTQTSNQSDSNTSGPEIEIAGLSLGAGSNGFNITGASVSVNSVVMNRFESQIQLSATTANNFVVTRSYFGIDVRALADYTTTQKYGIHVNAVVTGVVIGNTTADGNVFGGFDINAGANEDSGVHLVCGTSGTAQQVTISGNYFGMNPAGTVAFPNFYGIWSRNNCDLLIGGNTAANRNYIGQSSSRGVFLRPANTNLPNIRIFNNYFGTDSTATQGRPNNGDILIQGLQDYTGAQNPIMIGDSGKGNLFLNPVTHSIQISSYRRIDIAYNSILAYQGIVSLLAAPAMTPTVLMTVSNNYLSTETNSDPYFSASISIPNEVRPSIAIEMDRDPVIKGNLFEKHNIALNITPTRVSSTLAYRGLSQPVLGGTSNFTGSLCGGLEKNCLTNLDNWTFDDFTYYWPGYVLTLANPIDEAAFITNNDVSTLNPTDILISRSWYGSFELFSGTNRRTDLTNNTYDLPFPSNHEVIWFHGPVADYLQGNTILTRNVRVGCTVPANCPASGATNGVSGQTTIITHFGYFSSFVHILEHNRLVDGTLDDVRGVLKFENNHQASQTFSFDGDATTHPIVGDRGETWTNDTLADADINDGTVAAYQLMEVELVDANPIFNGTEWVITVDSTSDEDNVSLTGYDDGSGAYSGGGVNGASGLPDGKTSLREAIIVANNFAQPVRIDFNIPTTDTGYRDLDTPNTSSSGDSTGEDDFWKISPTSGLPSIQDDIEINGESQELNQGDRFAANLTSDYKLVSNATTIGPDIVIDYGGNAFSLEIRGDNVDISKIGITGSTSTQRSTNVGTVNNVRFNQVEWFDNPGNALEVYITNTGTIIVENSIFKNNGPTIGRSLTVTSGTELFVRNNIFYSNSGASVTIQQDVMESTVENNFFLENSQDLAHSQIWIISASNITIQNNIFSGNLNRGVFVSGSPTYSSGVKILNNVMQSNSGISIDLEGGTQDVYLTTTNDSGDTDTGANELMNYPVITSVSYLGGGSYRIFGDIDGNPSEGPYDIELCLSDNNASGHGGCVLSFGTTVAFSPWNITVNIPGGTGDQTRVFSALATNAIDSTSEFSANFITTNNPSYTFQTYPIVQIIPIGNVVLDDSTPLLNWEPNGDPEIDHYEIYIDGVFVGLVPGNITEYQVTTALSLGEHTWQVIGFRADNSQGGASITSRFTITENKSLVTPLASYPVPISYPDVEVTSPISLPVGSDEENEQMLTTPFITVVICIVGLLGVPLILLFLLKKRRIYGVIYDKDTSIKLSGASIKLFRNDDLISGTTSDSQGRYSISHDQSSSFILKCNLSNYIEDVIKIDVNAKTGSLMRDIYLSKE
jgi:hypothetical protein